MEAICTARLCRYNNGIMDTPNETHSVLVGYILWIFGFTGSHRFYYGKPITGTIWFFTGGLLLIGWIIDLFLIPGMARRADLRYQAGPLDYTLAWILLTFLGIFGIHRFYMGKWITGIIYLLTGGLLGLGLLYDLWTLNGQVSEMNRRELMGGTEPMRIPRTLLAPAALRAVVELTPITALVGHDGWADGRLGDLDGSDVILSDFLLIDELKHWLDHHTLEKPGHRRAIEALADNQSPACRFLIPC